MHSATSLQGSGLVRTVGPCAQTRVAIETHSQTVVLSLRVLRGPLSRPPSLEQSERREVDCSLLLRYTVVKTWTVHHVTV